MSRARPSSSKAFAEGKKAKGHEGGLPVTKNPEFEELPTMSEWRLLKLSDFATTTSGGTPSRKNVDYFTGDIPWIKSGNLNDGIVSSAEEFITPEALKNSASKLFQPGTLMIALYGATIGKLGILAIPAATNQAVCGIFLPQDVSTKFIFYFLLHKRPELVKLGQGGAQPNISQQIIRDIIVPLPSFYEQSRIVERIEELFSRLDAGVVALREAKTHLQRYRQSVLYAAVTGGLTEGWRNGIFDGRPHRLPVDILCSLPKSGKTVRSALPDSSKMPAVPDTWLWTRLDFLCSIGSGMSVSKNRKLKNPVEVPYLRVANVQRGRLDLREIKTIKIESERLDAMRLQVGDILFNEGGDRDKLGRGWVWEEQIKDCITQNHVFRATVYDSLVILPKFLSHWSNTCGQEFFLDQGTQTTNLASINKGVLSSFPVPVPPIAEQRQIVDELEVRTATINHLETELEREIFRASQLRQSILTKAFSGALVRTTESRLSQEKTESPRAKAKPLNRHFSRALLSAEIVHRLHGEPTFGRIKHQKIFHLCEHIAEIEEIEGKYHREAAGPLDNKLIYSNEAELKKQKWYREVPRDSYGHAYEAMEKAGGHRKYLEGSWPEKVSVIGQLIELMRNWNTDRCEIFCTAYTAWNDLLIWGKDPTEEAILHEILERWHSSKKRFAPDRWKSAIQWMKDQGFAPTGFGKPTAEQGK